MRFNEFKIIKESAGGNVVVIGDSIANGIAGAGGVSKELTNPGKNTTFILQNLVTPFAKGGKAKGATVILSSGAANSANVTTEDGQKVQSENLGPVATQIKTLRDAGAKVMLVGVASAKTPLQKPTQYTKGKKWTIDYAGMNDQLASIAAANGATFLGPLEEFDPNIAKGDGIHPYNGYGKLFKEGSAGAGTNLGPAGSQPGAPRAKDKTGAATKPSALSVPTGRQGPAVADVQKALIALGYKLPTHGVDGIRGPETDAAVKQFQQANNLTVDGDPGPDTIAALNKAIASKGIKIEKSTEKDVKYAGAGGARAGVGTSRASALMTNSNTKGKLGEILDFIAKYESNGNYNIMVGGKTAKLTDMTIGEVLDMQRDMIKRGHESTAVGRYQYIRSTLAGTARQMNLDIDKIKFDERTQDMLAVHTLATSCNLDDWVNGTISDGEFLNKIAKIWASVPTTSGGSYYQGVGSNKAGTSANMALNTLKDIRTT